MVVVIFFLSSASALEPVVPGSSEKQEFVINIGQGFKEIAAALQQQGLIKSAWWFKIYSLLVGRAQQFKPGHYQLSPALSSVELVEILMRGPEDVTVIIQEGGTLVDIDHQLSQLGIIKAGELIEFNRLRQLAGEKSLEGFLFPDTYKLAAASPISRVVTKFLDNFQEKAGEIKYQDLILASLLEKEAAHPQDRLLASGILTKRLQLGMLLQVDAANVYIKCQGAYLTCPDEQRQLTRADLKSDSPYNTYRLKGLPPTPIANPGKEAIVAALNPQSSKYFYYISNPQTGRLIFSQDLDEHNGNRYKYLIR